MSVALRNIFDAEHMSKLLDLGGNARRILLGKTRTAVRLHCDSSSAAGKYRSYLVVEGALVILRHAMISAEETLAAATPL